MFFFQRKYKWGAPCDNEISIGIHLKKNKILTTGVISWSWAIKNHQLTEKAIVIYKDNERKRRFKLQIFSDKKLPALYELSPALNYEQSEIPITMILPPLIIKIKSKNFYASEFFQSTHQIVPGNYWIRVVYGGKDFGFECASDFTFLEII